MTAITRTLLDRLAEGRDLCAEIGLAEASIYGEAHDTIKDLLAALKALASTARTFRNVPQEDQDWTSLDDDALNAAFAAIAKAEGGRP
jgi:hypothetical protein